MSQRTGRSPPRTSTTSARAGCTPTRRWTTLWRPHTAGLRTCPTMTLARLFALNQERAAKR